MRNFKSINFAINAFFCSLILTLFFACSSDAEYQQPSVHSNTQIAQVYRIAAYPDNLDNPYEISGQLFSEIAEEYLDQEFNPDSTQIIINRVQSIANSNLTYYSLLPYNYETPNSSVIDSILAIKNPAQYNIDQTSILSSQAELKLKNFLDTLSVFNGNKTEVEVIITYIFSYESLIIADITFNQKEKEILLTTSSIVRHAFFFAKRKPKKNKDKDWDISWGNMYAAAHGSKDSTAKAIIVALVAMLIVNN